MPKTEQENQMAVQQPVHENRELQEERREQREQQLNQPVQNPLEQQPQDQLEQDIHILRGEEFVELNVPLAHADPVFGQWSSINRQRDRQKIRESARKSARKEAAAEQAQEDERRISRLRGRISAFSGNNGIASDMLLVRTMLDLEAGCYQGLKPRQDVTGHTRRRNEKRYSNAGEGNSFARSAAEEDVANLVSNLRRDICLDGDETYPESMQEYADAFYFTNKYGNEVAKEKTIALNREKKNGTITDEEYKARGIEIKKQEQFIMIQKSYASNFAPTMWVKARDLRARRLARQQIMDEGNSAYHQRMIAILDREIADLNAQYEGYMEMLRTFNDTLDTPRGHMQHEKQIELARLRRELKAAKPEKQKELEKQGRKIFEDYTYAGPLDEGRQIVIE